MYWIEVVMSNGKTIRRESEDLNYTYAVKNKYADDSKRRYKTGPYPTYIKAGNDNGQTGCWNLLEGIIT